LLCEPANAGIIGIDFTGGNEFSFAGLTLGWAFTPNQTIKVTSLGIWDEGGDGLKSPGADEVGLWKSDGTLLAETLVDNSATPQASSSTDGRWLFADVAPLLLQPGDTYILGVYYGGPLLCIRGSCGVINGDGFRYNVNASISPDLNFVEARYTTYSPPAGSSNPSDFHIAFPDAGDSTVGASWFGPNILFETAPAPVPEPSSLIVLGTGLATLVFLRRRLAS
jgi:hypothetical protein